jgi:ABC-type antimicrobial peptide transport system permease subunit
VGSLGAYAVLAGLARNPQLTQFLTLAPSPPGLILVAITVAAGVGFLSAVVPSYNASKMEIVEGLRYIG